QLPQLGEEVAATVRLYPALRSVTMRLLELLGAPEEGRAVHDDRATATYGAPRLVAGPPVVFEGVSARAGGHEVLAEITLSVRGGEHVAVVGPSGAGKSSLMGVLLGWLTPAQGRVLVDGVALDPATLERVRQATAWLDPAVHLWNQPLLDNVLYGAPPGAVSAMPELLAGSDLRRVIPHLPDGLQTELGESGALLSGGEGQRVRMARALTRARAVWKGATLFCVTHDIAETRDFDRVLLVDGGRLVEDGAPAALLARASRYREMAQAEDHIRTTLWTE